VTPTGRNGGAGGAEVSDRVRMPLLALITQQSLDEDYRLVADRRTRSRPGPVAGSHEGRGPGRSRRTGLVAVGAVVVCFGLLVGTAAAQTQREAGARASSRTALVDNLDAARSRVADQQQRAADLRDDVTRLQARLTNTSDEAQRSETRVRRLSAVAGFTAVTGPGLRVTVTESPRAAEDPDAAVKDSDLALLVNGLWQAGAEAVAVNGNRLTTTSSLTTSGSAIEVDGVGVTAPYVVEAIGDRRTLEADLLATSTGLYFAALAETFGFGYDTEGSDALDLPAAPSGLQRLRSARQDGAAADSDGSASNEGNGADVGGRTG